MYTAKARRCDLATFRQRWISYTYLYLEQRRLFSPPWRRRKLPVCIQIRPIREQQYPRRSRPYIFLLGLPIIHLWRRRASRLGRPKSSCFSTLFLCRSSEQLQLRLKLNASAWMLSPTRLLSAVADPPSNAQERRTFPSFLQFLRVAPFPRLDSLLRANRLHLFSSYLPVIESCSFLTRSRLARIERHPPR